MSNFLTLASAIVVGLLQPAAQPEVEPARTVVQSEPLTKAEIIALEIERHRRLTVPVTIMGQGPYRFMIDTGAQATVLSTALADELQLFDRGEATLIGTASERQVETTIVPEFALGSRQFTVPIAPLVERKNIGDADGILGIDSLQNQRVLLDFENHLIAVAEAEALGGNNGFDIIVQARRKLGQLIVHDAMIDGIAVQVIIDTGAQSSVGNLELGERLRRQYMATQAVMTDINGAVETGQVKVAKRLNVGRAALNNFAITFTDSPTFKKLGMDKRPTLILGMSELRLFRRVAIDFQSRRVLFDMPEDVEIYKPSLFDQATRTRR